MTLTSFQRHGPTRARGSASLCVIGHKVWHTRWHNVEFGYALSSILGNQVGGYTIGLQWKSLFPR
ncbi:MAG: hypothetical protein CBD11_06745 [Phycisphaera sp. TMED151]|nr:MAG: hypothetical protein CBD11_06745 [Phycisphaera sp. TMED151]